MPDVSSCHANRDADLAVGEATLEARVHGSRLDNPADLSPGRLVAGPQTSFRILDQLTQGREGGTGKGCKKSLERSHDAPDLSHFAKQGKQGKPHPPRFRLQETGCGARHSQFSSKSETALSITKVLGPRARGTTARRCGRVAGRWDLQSSCGHRWWSRGRGGFVCCRSSRLAGGDCR